MPQQNKSISDELMIALVVYKSLYTQSQEQGEEVEFEYIELNDGNTICKQTSKSKDGNEEEFYTINPTGRSKIYQEASRMVGIPSKHTKEGDYTVEEINEMYIQASLSKLEEDAAVRQLQEKIKNS